MNQILFSSPAKEIEQRRREVRASPRSARAHALLGMALQKHGHYQEAIASQKRALALDPKFGVLYGIMAAAMFAIGDFQGAAENYRRALKLEPNDRDLQRGLNDSLQAIGQMDGALESARQHAAAAPDSTDALSALALAQYAADDLAGAADSFRRVTEIDPTLVSAWIDRGVTERQLLRRDEALASLTRALELAPENARAHAQLGLCLREMSRRDEAVASLRRATELEPSNAAHWCELGVALQLLERSDEALVALKRSQQLDPDAALTLQALGHTYFGVGNWEEALRVLQRALDIHPSPSYNSMLLFVLSHYTHSAQELTRAHLAYADRWEAPLRAHWQPHSNDRDPQRRIRIGFVSPDLRHHAVMRFMEPIFGLMHLSQHLDVYVYYNHLDEDSMTLSLKSILPNWRSIATVSDEEAERMIRNDGIDVLIDLSGHSSENRLPLFARKPAPVQASWIGYAGTTGLQAMDYYISDQYHLPEGRYDNQFSEKIVRLPLSAAFLPPAISPDVNPLPAASNGYLTFGSFHRASKISRESIALWASLLRGLPTSRLVLGGQYAGTADQLLRWLDEEGIERSRIQIVPRAPVQEYLAQHHLVDICLSPVPYSGGTTICYALWMGVPTLFTIGATNPSHSAVCFQAHMGLSSFMADDQASYVALGRFLEQNIPTLSALRAGMRKRFNESVIGHPGVAAAGFEHAVRLMWQRWCAGQPAAPLRVRLADITATQQAAQPEAAR